MQSPTIKLGTLLSDGKQKWIVKSINKTTVTLRKQKGESTKNVSFSECEGFEVCNV